MSNFSLEHQFPTTIPALDIKKFDVELQLLFIFTLDTPNGASKASKPKSITSHSKQTMLKIDYTLGYLIRENIFIFC